MQPGVGQRFPLLASTSVNGILFLPFLRDVDVGGRRMGVADGVMGGALGCLGGGLEIWAESGVMVLLVLLVSEREN